MLGLYLLLRHIGCFFLSFKLWSVFVMVVFSFCIYILALKKGCSPLSEFCIYLDKIVEISTMKFNQIDGKPNNPEVSSNASLRFTTFRNVRVIQIEIETIFHSSLWVMLQFVFVRKL